MSEVNKNNGIRSALANTNSTVMIFLVLVAIFSMLLVGDKLTSEEYISLIVSGALVSLLTKLAKEG